MDGQWCILLSFDDFSARPPTPFSFVDAEAMDGEAPTTPLKRSNSMSSISGRTTIVSNPLSQSRTLRQMSDSVAGLDAGLNGTSILPVLVQYFIILLSVNQSTRVGRWLWAERWANEDLTIPAPANPRNRALAKRMKRPERFRKVLRKWTDSGKSWRISRLISTLCPTRKTVLSASSNRKVAATAPIRRMARRSPKYAANDERG